MTISQIVAILMLLQAFGVDTTTLNKVHDILIPPIVATVQQTTTEPVANPTQTTPVFGSVPCVDSPIFNLVPDKTTVPNRGRVTFTGEVDSFCNKTAVPFQVHEIINGNSALVFDSNIAWTCENQPPHKASCTAGSNNASNPVEWGIGQANGGEARMSFDFFLNNVPSVDFVISSMGQSATTTLTLDASN